MRVSIGDENTRRAGPAQTGHAPSAGAVPSGRDDVEGAVALAAVLVERHRQLADFGTCIPCLT